MAASSKSRSNAPVLSFTSSSPGRFSTSSTSSSLFSSSQPSDPFDPFLNLQSQPSTTFASSSSMATSIFNHNRPSSPTRVNLTSSSIPSFRTISLHNHHRSLSPNSRNTVSQQIVSKRQTPSFATKAKLTCMCSPTNHPGSFRCSYHRKNGNNHNNGGSSSSMTSSPIRLNLRRSAMTNSLVRIGTVEGDWVKRALTALIRPSSHQQRRRHGFQPRPSRLSIMSTAQDDVV